MRNFAGKNGPEKKVWGVLGKQETFYSPEQFQDKGRIIPLNANPLEAWDASRSRYIRRPQMPPMANDGQQAGVVGTSGPAPTPTPTGTPAVTPTNTQTSTPTPSITPSSTPYPLPIQPALWYDSTNLGSIDYIASGGTNYVSAWRSIGTYSKTLTGTTTDTMPIWSGSSQMPGSPLIVRFNKSTTAGLRDFLSQRFNSSVIPQSGITIFEVIAKPAGLNYSGYSTPNGFGLLTQVQSGNTTNGGFYPTSATSATIFGNVNIGANTNQINLLKNDSGVNNNFPITNYSATALNDKFLFTGVLPLLGEYSYFELNQSAGTSTTPIGLFTNTGLNQVLMGATITSGGTITANNAGGELGEIMIFNRVLTVSEQEQVQNYLRDKWRYDEWASPVPTPTQTPSNTQTSTPTPSITPSATPPFLPSNIADLFLWFDASYDASISTRVSGADTFVQSWNSRTGGYSVENTTAANQPKLVSGAYGLPLSGITFSGGTDFLDGFANALTVPTGNTTFIVGYVPNESNALLFDCTVTGGSGEAVYSLYTNANTIEMRGVGSKIQRSNWTSISKYPKLLAGVSGNTTTRAGTFNDSPQDGTSTFTSGLRFGVIRFSTSPATAPTNGTVYEMLTYNRVLTTTEINNVFSYLKSKWNYSTW